MDSSTKCLDCMERATPKGSMGANKVNNTNNGSQAFQSYNNVAKGSDNKANQTAGSVLQKGSGGTIKNNK